MVYKRLHCWDCGTQIVAFGQGKYQPLPHLREVKFGLSDGGYMQSPFCKACAEKPWTRERLIDFKAATDRAAGRMRPVEIVQAEEVRPVEHIAGVLA